jgi:uncharacterized repeat protein (TIGR01451 family)
MIGRRLLLAALCAAACLPAPGAAATHFVEHEFRFTSERVRVEQRDGRARLVTPGAAHEDRAGRPDVPWFAERVEVPAGQRITGVEVLGIDSELVAERVRLESAPRAQAGAVAPERTVPDPAYFATDRAQPESVVELGAQGHRRGVAEAWLRISPVRWTPTTGRLERVTRVRVRLTLEAATDAAVAPRERIVPEWEAELPAGGPMRRERISGAVPARSLKGRAEPFAATQVPSVLGSPVAYLIITNEAMKSEYQRLADWKTQTGLPAVVRTIEFIRTQYPGAADDAERMRKFIRDAYSRWGTQWVLLGGDTEVLPTRFGYTTFYGGNYIATDLYFSCLDGNWNADGDSIYGEGYFSSQDPGDACDLLPEVYVGRATTTTLLAAQRFVNRVFQYSRTPVGDYETNVIFFAEVLFPQDYDPGMFISLDGAELVEEVLPIFNGHPEFHLSRLYENYTEPSYTPGSLPLSKSAVLDSLDVGYNIAVHVGHGYRNTMVVGDESLDNADALGLTNGNRLTNLYAINCTSNAIDYPSIGEAFMEATNGGAVSNIGSTHFDFPTAGRVYQDEYFRLLVQDSVTSVGEAQARQKLPYVAFSVYDGVNRWTQFTLLLLGDPQMPIWTNIPRILAVSHPAGIQLSDSLISVNVQVDAANMAGARVTAYKANNDFSTGVTDASGNIVLPFRPDSLGSISLTVTAFNCRPYQGTVSITSTPIPAVVDPNWTIDDDNSGGTAGNGNGLVDAGETVELLVPLRNNGGSNAPAVSATITTTDPGVTITVPTIFYGPITSGSQVVPSSGFRFSTPYDVEDQRELPFLLRVFDGTGNSRTEKLQVVVHAPDMEHNSHTVSDAGGNSDGVPDPGETVTYGVVLRNSGTGDAGTVTVKMRNHDGLAAVLDSTASYGTLSPGQELAGDALVFVPNSPDARLELLISDGYGLLLAKTIDIQRPNPPADLAGSGQATEIQLQWHRSPDTDVRGYNIYRSTSIAGPFVKVNPVPTDRTSYYMDEGLAPLTSFYFRVTAVDSSGNESEPSFFANASTNPPTHAIFPIPLGGTTPSSAAVDHVYSGYPMAIFAGANVLYGWHPDGTSPVDADGAGTTAGDFSTQGSYFAAGPSIGDLDGDGTPEIIAPTWNDTSLYVFNPDGTNKAGWPFRARDPIWSSAAVGDLDNDGQMELVFASNGNRFYVLRSNGTEWMDGDSNPATQGVFKVLGAPYNYGSPALADIDNDTYLDIVFGSFDGNLYVWDRFGNNLPGFPLNMGSSITASVAVGKLDGPADLTNEIVVATSANLLSVINSNGAVRAPFPWWVSLAGTSKTPSPALADMNNDGYLDIVQAGTNGGIYVFQRTGFMLAPWNNVRYSIYNSSASESSPVVADINGDGLPDIVMGGEDGRVSALSNNGTMLPGFPIVLTGEVRGTPALCDCDGDGMTEIVLAGWDKLLHVWDYDFAFSPGKTPPWPQFHHDARRTGLASSLPFVGVGDPPAAAAPLQVEFALPAPNPARFASRFEYAIPSDRAGQSVDLSLFDVNGRRVKTLYRGLAEAGRRSVSWNLQSDEGTPARTGIYFARFQLGSEVRSHKFIIVH